MEIPVHFQRLLVLFTLLVCSARPTQAFRLTVLHTNDLHSRFDQVSKTGGECNSRSKCYGGVARIKHLADQIRAQNPNTVFLNAGDFFQVRYIHRSSRTDIRKPKREIKKISATGDVFLRSILSVKIRKCKVRSM